MSGEVLAMARSITALVGQSAPVLGDSGTWITVPPAARSRSHPTIEVIEVDLGSTGSLPGEHEPAREVTLPIRIELPVNCRYKHAASCSPYGVTGNLEVKGRPEGGVTGCSL